MTDCKWKMKNAVDLRLAHLRRVTNLVEEDEPLNPHHVNLLGSAAVMPRS
jgi:hypothetical protein